MKPAGLPGPLCGAAGTRARGGPGGEGSPVSARAAAAGAPSSWLGRRMVGLEQERLKRGESDFGAREGRRVPEVGGGVLSGVGELRRL